MQMHADAVKRFCWYVCLVGSRSGVRNLATPHMVPQVSGVSSVPFLHISLGESHRNSYVCQCPCMSLIQAGHSSSTKQGFGWALPLSVVPFWILWWNALTVRYCHFVTVIICAYLCFVAKSTARGITKHIHSKHSGDPKAGGAAKLDPNPQVQSM